MPLPTTNLTAHFDASVSTYIWENYQAGAPYHNTTPDDGDPVGAWEDSDAGRDFQWKTQTSDAQRPVWREGTPLLAHPCLDFDPSGTPDQLRLKERAGTTLTQLSSLITSSNFAVFISFLVEAVSTESGTAWLNHCLLAMDDNNLYRGLFIKKNGAAALLQGWVDPVTITRDIALNTPHVAAFRHTGGSIYLSVDGGAEASAAAAGNANLAGNPLIGTVSGVPGLNGRIGEIAIYNSGASDSNFNAAYSYFLGRQFGVEVATQPRVMVIN